MAVRRRQQPRGRPPASRGGNPRLLSSVSIGSVPRRPQQASSRTVSSHVSGAREDRVKGVLDHEEYLGVLEELLNDGLIDRRKFRELEAESEEMEE